MKTNIRFIGFNCEDYNVELSGIHKDSYWIIPIPILQQMNLDVYKNHCYPKSLKTICTQTKIFSNYHIPKDLLIGKYNFVNYRDAEAFIMDNIKARFRVEFVRIFKRVDLKTIYIVERGFSNCKSKCIYEGEIALFSDMDAIKEVLEVSQLPNLYTSFEFFKALSFKGFDLTVEDVSSIKLMMESSDADSIEVGISLIATSNFIKYSLTVKKLLLLYLGRYYFHNERAEFIYIFLTSNSDRIVTSPEDKELFKLAFPGVINQF